jgi:hypothetical protein
VSRTPFVALSVALAVMGLALARWAAGDLADTLWEDPRREAMDRRMAVTCRVDETKAWVVNELLDGRLTLRQAGDWFREMNAWLAADGNEDLIGPSPVVTGEEAAWRNVLVWARAELYRRRDPGAALAPLRAEYRQRFGHDADLDGLFRQTP